MSSLTSNIKNYIIIFMCEHHCQHKPNQTQRNHDACILALHVPHRWARTGPVNCRSSRGTWYRLVFFPLWARCKRTTACCLGYKLPRRPRAGRRHAKSRYNPWSMDSSKRWLALRLCWQRRCAVQLTCGQRRLCRRQA